MRITVPALAALACLAFQATAQMPQSPNIVTLNSFQDRSMWITIYDLGKTTQLDYGCVPARQKRTWTSGNYLLGSFYQVRAELMKSNDCKGEKVCDTTVQANPQYDATDNGMRTRTTAKNTAWELLGDSKRCYWDSADMSGTRVSTGEPPKPPSRPCPKDYWDMRSNPLKKGPPLVSLGGSYLETCRECFYEPPGCFEFGSPCDGLQASCKKADGNWNVTLLKSASKCKKDTIWNNNGSLACTR